MHRHTLKTINCSFKNFFYYNNIFFGIGIIFRATKIEIFHRKLKKLEVDLRKIHQLPLGNGILAQEQPMPTANNNKSNFILKLQGKIKKILIALLTQSFDARLLLVCKVDHLL